MAAQLHPDPNLLFSYGNRDHDHEMLDLFVEDNFAPIVCTAQAGPSSQYHEDSTQHSTGPTACEEENRELKALIDGYAHEMSITEASLNTAKSENCALRSSINEHKAFVARQQEEWKNASETINALTAQNTDLKAHLRRADESLEAAKEERASLQTSITKLKHIATTSRSDLQSVSEEVSALKANLTSAQDFICAIQPAQFKTPESEILADYSSLCDSIVAWVDTHTTGAIDDPNFVKYQDRNDDRVKEFLSYLSMGGLNATAIRDTDEENIEAAIMQFLMLYVFKTHLGGVLSRGRVNVVNEIADKMRKLVPKRGIVAIRLWRSEAFRALTLDPAFDKKYDDVKYDIASYLAGLLECLVQPVSQQELQRSIALAIVEPAFALAHKMFFSTDVWQLHWSDKYHDLRFESLSPTTVEFVDIEAAGKTVTLPLQRGTEMHYILDVFPALTCLVPTSDGHEPRKWLKKHRILVATSHASSSRSSHEVGDKSCTLLGRLHEAVHHPWYRRLRG